jgi:hypothetical protein
MTVRINNSTTGPVLKPGEVNAKGQRRSDYWWEAHEAEQLAGVHDYRMINELTLKGGNTT